MKRREFVKTIATAGAGLVLPGPRGVWAEEQVQPNPDVKQVLVMFKCHFDAGFIDTQYNVVHKRYFEKFFPQAIEIARGVNADGERRFVWTTGSWLIYEYLEQASASDRKTMEGAIERGDIVWHGLPFTWQTEMLSASMIEGSLTLARSLDLRFGKVTTGAKMTDVPGHTRGLIAPLANNGIRFLEIGVNGGSTPAELPPLFVWKNQSGGELMMMYHHEYGDTAVVGDLGLVTEVRGDNSGPHTPEEIAKIHASLAARFPNAQIRAASLSEMANALEAHRNKLPLVTDEIGDTWIHGCASDPLKVARYRALSRLRESWIRQGKMSAGDKTDLELLRHVLLEAEHTWGTDTKTWLDFDNYEPADLEKMLGTNNYKVVMFSWIEKRQDLLDGIATLPEALRQEALLAIEDVTAVWPVALPKAKTVAAGETIETAHFLLKIDARTGAIIGLTSKGSGRVWASENNPVALLTYQTLSADEFKTFMGSYLTTHADWATKDFGKPNIERYGARSEEWHPERAMVSVEETDAAHRVVIGLTFSDDDAFKSGRAAFPRQGFVEMELPKDEEIIRLTVSWFGKPATRMPEALWLTFNPAVEDVKQWAMHKSGEAVSPFEVVKSGNRHMHAVERGFEYKGSNNLWFAVETLDTPVVALGERSALMFSNDQPDLSKGFHSCLFNNTWGTNYIMWYGEDVKARYVLRLT